jgi:hypothetical protein
MNVFEKAEKLVTDVNAVLEGANTMKDAITEYGLERYNVGVEVGKSMIQLPDATDPAVQYTQEQMNDAVSAGKKQQRDEDVLEFSSKLNELQAQIDAIPGMIESAKAEATAAAKAEFIAKLDAQQAIESESEAKLKSEIAGE